MNSRNEIEKRNEKYFEEYLNITKEEYFDLMRKAGKPREFGDNWSSDNPTAGRCGSVINAFRLSGKVPEGYIPCWQKDNVRTHYYFINQETNEVIDPTYYQMNNEYDYRGYKKSFLPQVGKNVVDIMEVFNLKIDQTKFAKKMSRNTLIVSKKK